MSRLYGNVVSAGDQTQILFSEHFGSESGECDLSLGHSQEDQTGIAVSGSVNGYVEHSTAEIQLPYAIVPYGAFKGHCDTRNSRCINPRLHYEEPDIDKCVYCKHMPYVPSPLRESLTARDTHKQSSRKHERSSTSSQSAQQISRQLNELIDVLIELKDSGIYSGETTHAVAPTGHPGTHFRNANKENEDIRSNIQSHSHSKHGFFRNPNISKMCNSVSSRFKSISSTSF